MSAHELPDSLLAQACKQYELYNLALKTWGLKAQMHKLSEEAAELTAAAIKMHTKRPLCKTEAGRDKYLKALIDELADVEIMSEQIIQALRLEDALTIRKAQKLDRLAKKLSRKHQ